jgi:prepilin-type N-terminal cleavage/methylation domain-containing protein/prepilin-type processing-associated H-X9-DG protein
MTYNNNNNISKDYATGDNFPIRPSEGLESTVTPENNSKLHSFARSMIGKSKEEIGKAEKQAGFTLVEILVTMGIITALGAMLMPALSGAREKARRTICANNQRQIVLAMNMYAQDNDGVLPIENILGNGLSNINGEKCQIGRLYPEYLKKLDTFFCPAQESYKINNPLTGAQNFGIPGGSCLGSYTVRRYLEEVYTNGFISISKHKPNWAILADTNSLTDMYENPIRSHKGKGVNVAYGDGSVKWFSGKYDLKVVGILDSDTRFDIK